MGVHQPGLNRVPFSQKILSSHGDGAPSPGRQASGMAGRRLTVAGRGEASRRPPKGYHTGVFPILLTPV
jgi:hypothetical protein